MNIPRFWAESRLAHEGPNGPITLRRFGWSDTDNSEAQAHADARCQEALQQVLAGAKLPRRERKAPYNGADGVPIREEIVAYNGDTVTTRNSYGARCLNTPNVFFADIDYPETAMGAATARPMLVGIVASVALAIVLHSLVVGIVSLIVVGYGVRVWYSKQVQSSQQADGAPETRARARINAFLTAHPDWALRIYRTPAGLRLMATHRLFDPNDSAVKDCFDALGVDPMYARMCLNQQCFRARLSGKPWRMGMSRHMPLGVWPIAPEKLPERDAWITKYESKAGQFAACAFVESLGSGVTHPDVVPVQELHDLESKALSGLPAA